MTVSQIDRLETTVERSASALFAAAIAYAAFRWFSAFLVEPLLGASAAGAGGAAYLLASGALAVLAGRQPGFAVPMFDLREFDAFGPDELLLTDRLNDELLLTEMISNELVLTDADRLEPAEAAASDDSLVLDDVLKEIGSEARVVRLFDRTAMPTPGQLKDRIDDHLGQGSAATVSSDASQALSDALAELKRSLR